LKRSGISDFRRDLQIAYGSFGIAWRLLDDIKDIRDDIKNGTHSAIYLYLPEKIKTYWGNNRLRKQATTQDSTNAILSYILEHSLIDKIKEKICAELEISASIVEAHKMTGLAREFRRLAQPLRNSGY
jgi:hypothetical protein